VPGIHASPELATGDAGIIRRDFRIGQIFGRACAQTLVVAVSENLHRSAIFPF
jgi:hypothetical protein